MCGLAVRPEGDAAALRALHRDQPIDDVAARHQQLVHVEIDAVDLVAQLGKLVGGREIGRITGGSVLHGACLRPAGGAGEGLNPPLPAAAPPPRALRR